MLHSKDNTMIKNLWEWIGFFCQNTDKIFLNKNWKRQTLDHFVRKLQTTGSVEGIPGSIRPQSFQTADKLVVVTTS